MKRFLLAIVCILVIHNVNGQDTFCGSVLDLNELKKNTILYNEFLSIENKTARFRSSRKVQDAAEETIIIPVVVHVLHHGEAVGVGLNISEAQITSQINVLNEDFKRLNADRTQTPSIFQPFAADINIEFRLARIDPHGNPTSGIQRRRTTSVVRSDNNLDTRDRLTKFTANGGLDAWDASRYLNIWVRDIRPSAIGQLLGYAQFPHNFHNSPNTDGVVILTSAFGRGNYNLRRDNNMGRTTTHEVGHWLNLFHIWGDNAGCSTGTDFCNDTPDQFFSNSGCGQSHQSCTTTGDMFMNYMDYTNDDCMNLFTNDQKTRMRSLFELGGIRENLKINGQIMFAEISGPATLCDQAAYTIENLPQGAAVQWSAGNSNLILAAQQNNTAVFKKNGKETGVINARITVGGNTVDAPSKQVWIGTPIINEIQGQQHFPNGGIGSFYAHILSDADVSYNWSVYPSLPISFSGSWATVSFPSSNGDFRITLTVTNKCGSTVHYYYVSTGEYEPFIAFPNPATTQVTVQLQEKESDDAQRANNSPSSRVYEIQLWSATALLKSYKTDQSEFQIPVSGLAKGIYFVRVIKDGQTHTQKLIKN